MKGRGVSLWEKRLKLWVREAVRFASGGAVCLLLTAGRAAADEFFAERFSVAGDPRGDAPQWVQTAAGLDLGLVDFDLKGSEREWNLGIGHGGGPSAGPRRSFLGGGLAVSRPPTEEGEEDGAGSLGAVEVRPWAGGCYTCVLGPGVHLGMEMRWEPGNSGLVDAGDSPAEGRVGVTFGVEW